MLLPYESLEPPMSLAGHFDQVQRGLRIGPFGLGPRADIRQRPVL